MLSKVSKRRSPQAIDGLIAYLMNPAKTGWATIENFGIHREAAELALAVREFKDTQRLNTRATADKTYHLIASFRAGEKPSLIVLSDVQRTLAAAVGMAAHQRFVALHTNTEHWHLHIAINRIHPDTYRCARASWDYPRLSAACRRLEHRHQLARDRGLHTLTGDGMIQPIARFETNLLNTISPTASPSLSISPSQPAVISPALSTGVATFRRDVRDTGEITYTSGDKPQFIDQGQRIAVANRPNDTVVQGALKTAQAKWGDRLTVAGTQAFLEAAVRVNREHDLGLSLTTRQQAIQSSLGQTLLAKAKKTLRQSRAAAQRSSPAEPAPPRPGALSRAEQIIRSQSPQALWRGFQKHAETSAPQKGYYVQFERRPKNAAPGLKQRLDVVRVLAADEAGALQVAAKVNRPGRAFKVIAPEQVPESIRRVHFNDQDANAHLTQAANHLAVVGRDRQAACLRRQLADLEQGLHTLQRPALATAADPTQNLTALAPESALSTDRSHPAHAIRSSPNRPEPELTAIPRANAPNVQGTAMTTPRDTPAQASQRAQSAGSDKTQAQAQDRALLLAEQRADTAKTVGGGMQPEQLKSRIRQALGADVSIYRVGNANGAYAGLIKIVTAHYVVQQVAAKVAVVHLRENAPSGWKFREGVNEKIQYQNRKITLREPLRAEQTPLRDNQRHPERTLERSR